MKKILILFGIILSFALNAQIPGTPDANGVITVGSPWVTGTNTGAGELQAQLAYLYSLLGGTFDTVFFSTDTKMYYDTASRTNSSTTGVADVVVQIGQEMHQLVYNNSGAQIDNGKICYGSGVNSTYEVIEIGLADNTVLLKSLSIAGVATHNIADNSLGLVTAYGFVRDFDASALTTGMPVYLGTSGDATPTRPLHPANIVFMGICLSNDATTGKIHIDISHIERTFIAKSYNFTSQGIGSGTYWRAGYYDAAAADVTLTQGSTTQTYGTANVPYAAHPFIVAGGAGSVDAGTVGLRVTGTSITDAGVLTGSDADTITTDITTLSADDYLEAKKFVSTVTYELITTSGSPTTYSLDFNYGYAKYEDFGNQDFTIIGTEFVGLAGATDTNFGLVVYHHSDAGWTYHASAFEPGGTEIASMYDDMQPYDNLTNGIDFAWKRVGLNYYFEGADSEGVIVKIVCGANNSVQSMDIHIGGKVE